MKRTTFALAFTLLTAATASHADQCLNLVSVDGKLNVTMYGSAVKYSLNGGDTVVCNGQNFSQEGIDNYGNLYKTWAQICKNNTGIIIKHFTEKNEVLVAITDDNFKRTFYKNNVIKGNRS